MVQIVVNEALVTEVCQPIPGEIKSLEVVSIGRTPVSKQTAKEVADWVYDLSQRCTGNIVFNGNLVPKTEVNKYLG